jgi:hypothetical protein
MGTLYLVYQRTFGIHYPLQIRFHLVECRKSIRENSVENDHANLGSGIGHPEEVCYSAPFCRVCFTAAWYIFQIDYP